MRQALDWFLTANLLIIICLCGYWWYSGDLSVQFKDQQVATVVDTDITHAFATTLKMEVDRSIGVPSNGYTPEMFLAVFPGLAPTDFAGVEASIGEYEIKDGSLQHIITAPHLRHEAATAITSRGMERLLRNITARLGIDLKSDGTITQVMLALSQPD